jgi:hypothetical protein
MPSAEQVATILGFEFLRQGNFSAAAGPVLMPLPERVSAVADDERGPALTYIEGFSGLSIQAVGYEEGVEEPKVHIYLSRGSASIIRKLPHDIEEVPVVAHKMGPIVIRPDAAGAATNRPHLFERNGRICCGSSCGPTSERSSGTLGALARLGRAQQLYLLSNNHVLAGCNHVPRDQPILSPSSGDSGPGISAPREIGRHDRIHELRTGDPIFVTPCDADLALARATDANVISSWQGSTEDGYDTPTQVQLPVSMMRVKKFGRTTGLTTGRLEAKVNVPTPVAYNSNHFKGVVWFKDVWTIRGDGPDAFALKGDSGSLVVTEDASRSVGIVFAVSASGDSCFIIPMERVLDAFGGIHLVGGHGVDNANA